MSLFGFGEKDVEEQEPEYINSVLKTPMLNYKVYVMSKSEEFAVHVALFVAGGVVGLIFYGGLFKVDGVPTMATYIANLVSFAAIGIFANVMFTPMYVESRLEKRKVMLNHQFRDMLDALASSFATGSNVTMAFRNVLSDLRQQYDEDAYIVCEMREIVAAEQQSFPIADMLRSFAERSGDDDIQSFSDVFDIVSTKGGSMSAIIQRIRVVLVDKAEVTDEIRTKLTSNKIQHNAMSVMPIFIVLFLRLSNDTLAKNFATPAGVACCTVALCIFFGAYRYGKRIINVRV